MEEIRDILRRIVERSPELRDRLILSEVSSSWREVVISRLNERLGKALISEVKVIVKGE